MKRFASPSRHLAIVCGTLLLLTALWLLVWKKPLGRDNWFITPHALWPPSTFVFPVCVLLLCGGFAAMSAYDRFRRAKSRREERTSLRMSLGALMLLATLWPWSLLGPRAISGVYLVSATWSDISNQYFSTAYRIRDARDFTRHYETQQRNYDITKSHVATHPPGAVLFYYGARKIYEHVPFIHAAFTALAPGVTAASTSSVAQTIRGQLARSHAVAPHAPPFSDDAVGSAIWCAFLLSLCVGATVPAVYKLAAGESSTRLDDERGREKRGLMGAALFALSPSAMLFAFTLDALMMCLVAWSLVLVARRVTSGATVGIGSAVLAGALIGIASFVSFGALAVWGLLIFAFVIGFGWRSFLTTPQFILGDLLSRRKPAVHRPFSDLLWLVVGFIGAWIVLTIAFAMQPQDIYNRAMEAHHAATLTTRSHAGWALLNLVTFALFCGWSLTVGVLSGAWTQLRNWRARQANVWNAASVLGVASLLLCVTLSLSGNVRGETERLWLFLLPPLCAFAASQYLNNEYSNRGALRFLMLLVVVQAAQTLLMAAALAPLIRAY